MNDAAGISGVYLPERRIVDIRVRTTQVYMIECVEEFRPELKSGALENVGVLKERNVPVSRAGPADNALPAVAVRSCNWVRKGSYVEPFVLSGMADIGIPDAVRIVAGAVAAIVGNI